MVTRPLVLGRTGSYIVWFMQALSSIPLTLEDCFSMAASAAIMTSYGYDTFRKCYILEEFKEIDVVKSLISNLVNIYNDQIASEASLDRFTCKWQMGLL